MTPPSSYAPRLLLLWTLAASLLQMVTVHGATITWSGAAGDNLWNTSGNWVSSKLPRSGDDVVINAPSATVVTLTAGADIRSLQSEGSIKLSGGTLRVSGGASEVRGRFQMAPGATIEAVGIGTTFDAIQATNIDQGTLTVSDGAVLRLPGVRSYAKTKCEYVTWQVTGKNSRLVLPNLQEITPTTGCGHVFYLKALDGGHLELPSLTTINDGYLDVQADGTNSLVDLSSLVRYRGDSAPGVMQATHGGEIRVPQLAIATHMEFRFSPGAVLSLPALTNIDLGTLTVSDGAVVSLPGVRSYAKTKCEYVTWQVTGKNSRLVLPNLQEITPTTGCGHVFYLKALDGGHLELPGLTTINDGYLDVQADGTNSLVDLSSLVRYRGDSATGVMQATRGGEIRVPQLAIATRMEFRFSIGAALSLPALTNIDQGTLTVSDGAVVSLPGVRSYAKTKCEYVTWQVTGKNSRLVLPNLQEITPTTGCGHVFYLKALDGGHLELPGLTTINDGYLDVQADGTNSLVDLSSFVRYRGDSATGVMQATRGGEIRVPQLAIATHMEFRFSPGAVLSLPALTNIDQGTLTVSDGAVVSLPGVRSYAKTKCEYVTWQVTGKNSRLMLPNLQEITPTTGCGHVFYLKALDGGHLELPSLTTINDGYLDVLADSTNSLVDLPSLTRLSPNTAWMNFRASGGGQVNLAGLQSISGGTVQILAEGVGSVVDLSVLSAFTARTGTQSSLKAQNRGVIILNSGAIIIANVTVELPSNRSVLPAVIAPSLAVQLYGYPWRSYLVEIRDTRSADSSWVFFRRVPLTTPLLNLGGELLPNRAYRVTEFVADPALLEISRIKPNLIQIVLYGNPVKTYGMQTTVELDEPQPFEWTLYDTVVMTNSFRILNPPLNTTGGSGFYRAMEQ